PLLKSVTKATGATVLKRTNSLGTVTSLIGKTTKGQLFKQKDPLVRMRKNLQSEKIRLQRLEEEVKQEIQQAVDSALVSVN
ncbi:MAG: hypothetical protein ACE5HX_11075, partial [bacterium]